MVAFASGLVHLKCRDIDLNKGDVVIFSKYTHEIYENEELKGSGVTFFDGIKLVADVQYYKEKLDTDIKYDVTYVIPKYLDIFHGFPVNYWNRVIPEYYMDLLYRLKEPLFSKQLQDNLVFDTFFTEIPSYRTSFVIPKEQKVLKKINDQIVSHIIKDLSNIVLEYELYDEYHIIIGVICGEPSGSEKELLSFQNGICKINDPDFSY